MPSPRPRRSFALALALAFALPLTLQAQEPYKSPPPEIVAILDAPPFPTALVSPDKLSLLLVEQPSLPALAEVGQPMLRLTAARRSEAPRRPRPVSVSRQSLPPIL